MCETMNTNHFDGESDSHGEYRAYESMLGCISPDRGLIAILENWSLSWKIGACRVVVQCELC
jgi:hypothetical protein